MLLTNITLCRWDIEFNAKLELMIPIPTVTPTEMTHYGGQKLKQRPDFFNDGSDY